jgi:hypothetical protein
MEHYHGDRDWKSGLIMPVIDLDAQHSKTNDASFYYQMTVKLKLYEILSPHYFRHIALNLFS